MSAFLSDAALLQLAQENLLDGMVKDGLKSNLGAFRGMYTPQNVAGNGGPVPISGWDSAEGEISTLGQTLTLTGAPTLTDSKVLEQWFYEMTRKGDYFKLHENEAGYLVGQAFAAKMRKLGESMSKTLGVLARDTAFNAGVAGHALVTEISSGTTVKVSTLNGFTRNLNDYRYETISADNPLEVSIYTGATWVTRSVTGYSVANSTITIDSALTVAVGDVVVAETASRIEYVDSTNLSISDVATGDKFSWAAVDRAVTNLRLAGVQPMLDGFYYCYLSAIQMSQLKQSTEINNAFLSGQVTGSDNPYATGQVTMFGGVKFIVSDVPSYGRSDCAGFALPLYNATNVKLDYAIVVGFGGLVEKQVSTVGMAAGGLILVPGDSITGIVDGCSVVVKDAADPLNKSVGFAWDWNGAFVPRTDFLAGTDIYPLDVLSSYNAGYKRSCVIVSAR